MAAIDNYYLTHPWLQLWLQYRHPEQVYVLLFWKNDELQFAAPMVCDRFNYHGLGIRKLALTRDYYSPVGGIIYSGAPDKYIGAFVEHLTSAAKTWDVLDFDGLPMEYPESQALLKYIEALGWTHHVEDSFGDWVLSGVESWDDYWNGRAKRKLRRKSIVYRDRLIELGALKTRIISNGEDTDSLFEQFYRINQGSWKKDIERLPDFLRATMRLAASKGSLRIAFLDLDDKPIASWYAFLHRSVAYLPRTVYLDKFRRYMPGFVLLEDFLRHLVEVDKAHTIDFQHGDEAYKSRWASERRLRKRIIVANPRSWKGRFYVRGEYVYKPRLEPTLLWRSVRRARGLISGVPCASGH